MIAEVIPKRPQLASRTAYELASAWPSADTVRSALAAIVTVRAPTRSLSMPTGSERTSIATAGMPTSTPALKTERSNCSVYSGIRGMIALPSAATRKWNA
jgi:hypothetical protein